jgi:hypothetical protein
MPWITAPRPPAPSLQAFDLLELNGEDFRPLPFAKRKAKLARLLATPHVGIVLSEHTDEDGAMVFRQACAMGLEGIVSKRLAAPYRSGPSRDWLKVKRQPGDGETSGGAMVALLDSGDTVAWACGRGVWTTWFSKGTRSSHMKDDIRAAFERAAAQADAREDAELQKQQKQDKAQVRFKADFAQTLLKVIVPAVDEIGSLLQESGWVCTKTILSEGAGVRFKIHHGNMRPTGGASGKPHIEFFALPNDYKVRIASATPSISDGGRDYPLTQITGDFVAQQVLEFFEGLAANPRK